MVLIPRDKTPLFELDAARLTYSFTLAAGTTYTITGTSGTVVTVSHNVGWERSVDYVCFGEYGIVLGYGRGASSLDLTLGEGAKSFLLKANEADLKCSVLTAQRASLDIKEGGGPIFQEFRLLAGKTYVISQTGIPGVPFYVELGLDRLRTVDYISYNDGGRVHSSGNAVPRLRLEFSKIIMSHRITVNPNNDVQGYMPYASASKLAGFGAPIAEEGAGQTVAPAQPVDGLADPAQQPQPAADQQAGAGQQANAGQPVTPAPVQPTPVQPTPGQQQPAQADDSAQQAAHRTRANAFFDTAMPGMGLRLPVELLAGITDADSAAAAIQAALDSMTVAQKQDPAGIDLITLFAEEALAQAASMTVSGDVTINQAVIQNLQPIALTMKQTAERLLASSGVVLSRELRAVIKIKTEKSSQMMVTIAPSAVDALIDGICVVTPMYRLTFPKEFVNHRASSGGQQTVMMGQMPSGWTPSTGESADAGASWYSITLSTTTDDNYTVSFPPPPKPTDVNYLVCMSMNGNPMGGKYDPCTDTVNMQTNTGATVTVKENRKDFSDIASKSKEMRDAINILAAKGIINGTSATEFSPDTPIKRAEIATLLVRALAKFDLNADGGFTDVKKTDWFFSSAASAKKHGIMGGTGANTFDPELIIPKDQIVVVAARVLRNEMKYRNPTNVSSILSVYADSQALQEWSLIDLALATRENLVVKRSDGGFSPAAPMTRGDAALILYRLFMRLW
jgi:hypothetical protein